VLGRDNDEGEAEQFTVTSMTHSSLTYDPSANADRTAIAMGP
jgi:hypothetical protein